MSQGKLLGRVRKLTDTIQHIRAKFALPKRDQGRFDTYGGALSLQKAKEDRRVLQGQLDPIRLVATGVSCRDCLHFGDLDEPTCFFQWNREQPGSHGWPTKHARAGLLCGPEARWFESAALDA